MRNGRESTGHPVDVASGVEFTAAHDIEIEGSLPLVWRRFYSTGFSDSARGIHGRRWRSCFDVTLTRGVNGYLFLGHDGLELDFPDPDDSITRGDSVFNFGDYMELRQEGDQYAVYHWHKWDKPVKKFMFQRRNQGVMRLEAIQRPEGHSLKLRYDDRGQLLEVFQTIERRRLLFDYDARGLLTRLSSASAFTQPHVIAEYVYDKEDRLVEVRHGRSAGTRYQYDRSGRLVWEIGPTGGEFRMRYDEAGRCVETTGRNRFMYRRLEYNSMERWTRVIDSLGNVTVYEYNESGQVETTRLPNGGVESSSFDDFGRLVSKIGPSGERLSFAYSDRGDVASITYPNDAVTEFFYNNGHQIVSIKQIDGGTWHFQYERGANVSITDPAGAVTNLLYDTLNRLIGFVSVSGNELRIAYSDDYSNIRYTDVYGLLSEYTYNERLQIHEVRDLRGLLRRFNYDELGHLTSIIEGDGTERKIQCDAAGFVLSNDPGHGRPVRYEYTAYAILRRVIDPNGFVYEYAYDSEGRLNWVKNPKGEREEYNYDAMGNLTVRKRFDGLVERYEFDASSRCIRRIKADGAVLAYRFDAGGNQVSVAGPEGILAENKFDLFHRLTETRTASGVVCFEYDQLGNLTAEIQNGRRVEFAHYPTGATASRTFQDARSGPLIFEYDRRQRLTAVRDSRRTLISFEYDPTNLLIRRRLGSAVEEWNYDECRRPKTQNVHDEAGRQLVARTFDYNHPDYLTLMRDSSQGEVLYDYDAAGHLLRSMAEGRRGSNVYVYDPCGNLLQRSQDQQLTYGPGNRLIQNGGVTYERDPNGNMTSAADANGRTAFTWNSIDQLVQIDHPNGCGTRYGYDGLGRRIIKEHDGELTRFYWSRNDLLAEECNGSTVEYLVAGFLPQLAWSQGNWYYFILSRTPRPSELLNGDGQVIWRGSWDDFGLPSSSPPFGIALFGITGQYWDKESSLFYNRFRYFSPRDGRFVSPDPIRTHGGLNEYVYGVNPINWVDPYGLTCGLTHLQVVVNPDIKGRGGEPDPTMADWAKKQDAFNAGVQDGINRGVPLLIPTPAQYQADRAVGNAEARDARIAQGMGPGVQADHPVDLSCGGGQGQSLYPLAGGVNGSFGSQLGPQASALGPGAPTPKVDLYDKNGNLIRPG